jgi:hypothetical protein
LKDVILCITRGFMYLLRYLQCAFPIVSGFRVQWPYCMIASESWLYHIPAFSSSLYCCSWFMCCQDNISSILCLPLVTIWSSINVTFISPCVVIYSYSTTKKMHLFLKLFILVKRSTCFKRSFRLSSGAQNCTYGKRRTSNSCCHLLLVGTKWNCSSILSPLAAGSSSCLMYACCHMCSFELKMTGGKTVRNKVLNTGENVFCRSPQHRNLFLLTDNSTAAACFLEAVHEFNASKIKVTKCTALLILVLVEEAALHQLLPETLLHNFEVRHPRHSTITSYHRSMNSAHTQRSLPILPRIPRRSRFAVRSTLPSMAIYILY